MKNLKKYSHYSLAYLLWALSIVVSAWGAFRVRDAIMSLLVISSLDRYESGAREQFYTALQFRATETWSYLFIGMVVIVVIVVLESVFRTSVPTGQVWSRFSLVTAIEFGVLCLAELVITLTEGAIQPLTWGNFIPPLIYLVAAILFGWLWISIRPKPGAA
jgi:hypothetical protein